MAISQELVYPIQCFLLQPVNRKRRYLRRYDRRYLPDGKRPDPCPLPHGYHDAQVYLDEVAEEVATERIPEDDGSWPRDDPRWPQACACGYVFQTGDEYQLFTESLWKRADTGEIMTLGEAPIGAIYDAYWWPDERKVDGQYLVCKVPGGEHGHWWMIDAKANNCDSLCANCQVPYYAHDQNRVCGGYQDSKPGHRCWVRHGQAPNLHVDKQGNTCGAGAGSIQTGSWHGFLRSGTLVKA